MKRAENFFSNEEKKHILQSIQTAEENTSGEIRVHIENHCTREVLDRAAFLFGKLKMHKTEKRNGVLFYLAIADKKFAILGDAGINAVTPDDFWDGIKDSMAALFSEGKFTDGLCKGIEMTGEALKKHFPHMKDDINEQKDDISFGNK
jgi:uncharacterized membrane protein